MGSVKKDILVLGAGLSGLGAAWHINKKKPDLNITILERLPHLGGLAMSPLHENKYYLDFGPHFLTVETEELMNKIKLLVGDDLLEMQRLCLLYFNNSYMSYPPSPKNILFELGPKTALLSTLSYIKSRIFYKKNFDNFEDWSKYNFGDHLYNIFFKPYTENFWGMKCTELASKWADARVSKMSFVKALMDLFIKSVQNTSIMRDKLPMYYPKKGTGEFAKKMAKELKDNGADLVLGSSIVSIKINKNSKKLKKFEVTSIENGSKKVYHADYLLSTIPMTQFIGILEPTPPPIVTTSAKSLKFRSLLVMHIVTKKKDILNAPYIYYHGRSYHRLTESAKISKSLAPEGENMICVEKSCFVGDEVWSYDKKKLFELFITDLEKDGILRREDVIKTFLMKEEHVYPVYAKNFNKPLDIVKKHLDDVPNFRYLGRPGAFLYLDMDQSLERSFKIAESLLDNIVKGK